MNFGIDIQDNNKYGFMDMTSKLSFCATYVGIKFICKNDVDIETNLGNIFVYDLFQRNFNLY